MFQIVLSLVLICVQESFAQDSLPELIDFKRAEAPLQSQYDVMKYERGIIAFNSAPELFPFFAALKRDYQIDTVIETGTFLGATTAGFSLLFNEVHTIEIIPDTYNAAKFNLAKFENIKCYQGSSPIVLREILPTLKGKRILFYLDAHWESYWPLLDEILEIAKTHENNCIIVIDDFKVPGRGDIPYDTLGPYECSHEYVATNLNKVFSDYSYHYLIPNWTMSRAKFVAIPRVWQPL